MSASENSSVIPTWFWIASILALVWNLLGVIAYIQQVTLTPEALAAMAETERALYENTPAWANAAFAIAVFGGALGSLLMLIKKALAESIFIVSLIAVLVQMSSAFFIMDSFAEFGPGVVIMPIIVIAIACLLVWFARSSKEKSWIS